MVFVYLANVCMCIGGATLVQAVGVASPFSEEGQKIGWKMHGNVSNLKNLPLRRLSAPQAPFLFSSFLCQLLKIFACGAYFLIIKVKIFKRSRTTQNL